MPLAHDAHELLLRFADIEQRLPGLGILEEHDEVHRVACGERDADLGVVLEACDAGTVPGARVDDDVRPQLRIDLHAGGRDDGDERVVHRLRKGAGVGNHLVLELEHRRDAVLVALDVVVAALAQRVPEENRALHEIDRVVVRLAPRLLHVPGDRLARFGILCARRLDARGVSRRCCFGTFPEQGRDPAREVLAFGEFH